MGYKSCILHYTIAFLSRSLLWGSNSPDYRWIKSLGCFRSSWQNCPCCLASSLSPASSRAEFPKPARLLKRRSIISLATAFTPFYVIFSSGRGVNITGLRDVHPWTSHDTSLMSWVKNFFSCFLVVLHNGEQLWGGSMPKARDLIQREKLVKIWGLRVFIHVKVTKAHPLTGRGWGWKGVTSCCQAPSGDIFFQNGSLLVDTWHSSSKTVGSSLTVTAEFFP